MRAAFALRADPDRRTNPAPSHSGHLRRTKRVIQVLKQNPTADKQSFTVINKLNLLIKFCLQVFAREEDGEGGSDESHSNGAGDQVGGAVGGDVSNGGDHGGNSLVIAAALAEG